jgi:hypothetical protein
MHDWFLSLNIKKIGTGKLLANEQLLNYSKFD